MVFEGVRDLLQQPFTSELTWGSLAQVLSDERMISRPFLSEGFKDLGEEVGKMLGFSSLSIVGYLCRADRNGTSVQIWSDCEEASFF